MRSAIETARIVAREAAEGNSPGRYTSLVLSEAEQDASSIARSFAVVQPPSERVDRLRADLSTLLDECSSTLADLRIAAYRGDNARIAELAETLPALSRRLERFVDLTVT